MDLGLDAADHANGIAEVGLGMARRMRPTIGGHRGKAAPDDGKTTQEQADRREVGAPRQP